MPPKKSRTSSRPKGNPGNSSSSSDYSVEPKPVFPQSTKPELSSSVGSDTDQNYTDRGEIETDSEEESATGENRSNQEEDEEEEFSDDDFTATVFKVGKRPKGAPGFEFDVISSDTSIAEDQEPDAWIDYKHFKETAAAADSALLPQGFEYQEAARQDPKLKRLAVAPWDLGLHRLAKILDFQVPPPPEGVVPVYQRLNRWGTWYYSLLLSQIRAGTAGRFNDSGEYIRNGVVYDTPRQRAVWAEQGIDWPIDEQGLLPFPGFNKLGAASSHTSSAAPSPHASSPSLPPSPPSPPPSGLFVDGIRAADPASRVSLRPIRVQSEPPQTSLYTHTQSDRTMGKGKSLVKTPAKAATKASTSNPIKEKYELVPLMKPDSGWGVDSSQGSSPGYKVDDPDMTPWHTSDVSLAGLTDEERADVNKGVYPARATTFGIWNVSDEQLQDPTWKPIPYRILDEACMLIVMCLSKTNKQRGQFWPFNFDNSGNPRPSRFRFGPGVVCHYGREDGKGFHEEIVSYLVYKRHHIFGGLGSKALTISEKVSKEDRMKLSMDDPNFWSHGTELKLAADQTEDDGVNGLHLYFYHNHLRRGKYVEGAFIANRPGFWFSHFHQGIDIPYMLDDAVRATDQDPPGAADDADQAESTKGKGVRRSQRNQAEAETKEKIKQTLDRRSLEQQAQFPPVLTSAQRIKKMREQASTPEGKIRPSREWETTFPPATVPGRAGTTTPLKIQTDAATSTGRTPATGRAILESTTETARARSALTSRKAPPFGLGLSSSDRIYDMSDDSEARDTAGPGGFNFVSPLPRQRNVAAQLYETTGAPKSGYEQVPTISRDPARSFRPAPFKPPTTATSPASGTGGASLKRTADFPPGEEPESKRVRRSYFEETAYPTNYGLSVPARPGDMTREVLHQEVADLLEWFRTFDEQYPLSQDEGLPKKAATAAVLAAWQTESNGEDSRSLVERDQMVAYQDMRRRIAEINATTKNIENQLIVINNSQALLHTQVHALTRDMDTQPIYTHLRNARVAMTELVATGQIATARFIGNALKHRLTAEPGLVRTLDFDIDLPDARRLCSAVFRAPPKVDKIDLTIPQTSKPAALTRPKPKPADDDDDEIQVPAEKYLR